MLKCLSLWQPWAHLIYLRAKLIETRGWQTGYRGRIGIHAAKKWDRSLASICATQPFAKHFRRSWWRDGDGSDLDPEDALDPFIRLPDMMVFGAVIATADLVGCDQMMADESNWPTGDERAFGIYAPGRFMWRLENMVPMHKPHYCRGRQQLFDVPELEAA